MNIITELKNVVMAGTLFTIRKLLVVMLRLVNSKLRKYHKRQKKAKENKKN